VKRVRLGDMVHTKAKANTEKSTPPALVGSSRKTPVIRLVYRIPLSKMIGIFERVNLNCVKSVCAQVLIKSKDVDFARYLVCVLTYDDIIKWGTNPNEETILAEVARVGFNFYNYH